MAKREVFMQDMIMKLAETESHVAVDTKGATIEGFVDRVVLSTNGDVAGIVIRNASRRNMIAVDEIKGIEWDEHDGVE